MNKFNKALVTVACAASAVAMATVKGSADSLPQPQVGVPAAAPKYNDDAPLLAAAEVGNVQALKELIANGADLTVRNKFDYTALHAAVVANQPAAVKFLLQAGIPVDEDSANGTPLILAAKHGHAGCAEILLQAGASTEMRCDGCTALYFAAESDFKESVCLLLLHGASANTDSLFTGETVLETAIKKNNQDVVRLLLLGGADTEQLNAAGLTPYQVALKADRSEIAALLAPPKQVNGDQLAAALEAAIATGNVELVETLLDCGADPSTLLPQAKMPAVSRAMWNDQAEIVQLLVNRGARLLDREGNHRPYIEAVVCGYTWVVEELLSFGLDANTTDEYGHSFLYIAVKNDHTYTAALLLEHGAEVNKTDSAGDTVLHYASRFGNNDMVKTLIEAGADVNAVNKDGETPLTKAVLGNNRSNIQSLLAAGAKPDGGNAVAVAVKEGYLHLAADLIHAGAAPVEAGCSPLHMAAACGNAQELDKAIREAADLNVRDHAGRTPLHCAVLAENLDAIRLLLAAGADSSLKSVESGDTPLIMAAPMSNGSAVAEALLNGGADVNLRNADGFTPLILAVNHGTTDTVRVMLAAGADPNLADVSYGETALHKAASRGRLDMIVPLLDAGAKREVMNNDGETPADVARYSSIFVECKRCYEFLKMLEGEQD